MYLHSRCNVKVTIIKAWFSFSYSSSSYLSVMEGHDQGQAHILVAGWLKFDGQCYQILCFPTSFLAYLFMLRSHRANKPFFLIPQAYIYISSILRINS